MNINEKMDYIMDYYGKNGIFEDTMCGTPMKKHEAYLLIHLMKEVDNELDSMTRERGKYVILFLREYMSCGIPGFALTERMCVVIRENGLPMMEGIQIITNKLINLHKEK